MIKKRNIFLTTGLIVILVAAAIAVNNYFNTA